VRACGSLNAWQAWRGRAGVPLRGLPSRARARGPGRRDRRLARDSSSVRRVSAAREREAASRLAELASFALPAELPYFTFKSGDRSTPEAGSDPSNVARAGGTDSGRLAHRSPQPRSGSSELGRRRVVVKFIAFCLSPTIGPVCFRETSGCVSRETDSYRWCTARYISRLSTVKLYNLL